MGIEMTNGKNVFQQLTFVLKIIKMENMVINEWIYDMVMRMINISIKWINGILSKLANKLLYGLINNLDYLWIWDWLWSWDKCEFGFKLCL